MTLTLTELIHPSAVIDSEAEIAPDVRIGPYAIIEGPVKIGPGCVIESHACLTGPMSLGRENFVGHGAVLGKSPQHKGYRGESTTLKVGDENIFREHVTIHRGTVQGGGETRIGHRNMFMVGSHIGHDCQVGNGCTLVNGALVAGHVILDDSCIPVRPHRSAAARADRPPGDDRRPRLDHEGHPSVRPPARVQLCERPQYYDQVTTPARVSRPSQLPACGKRSGSFTRKDGPSAPRSRGSPKTWGIFPRSPSSSPSSAGRPSESAPRALPTATTERSEPAGSVLLGIGSGTRPAESGLVDPLETCAGRSRS